MLPRTVAEVSPLDPLLLLPLPHDLPTPPELALDQVLADIAAQLNQLNHPSDITLLTSRMRMLTRHAQVLLNSARVGAAEARERLDTVDVSLKGVEYEHDRVRDEIAKCLRYSYVFGQRQQLKETGRSIQTWIFPMQKSSLQVPQSRSVRFPDKEETIIYVSARRVLRVRSDDRTSRARVGGDQEAGGAGHVVEERARKPDQGQEGDQAQV